MLEALLSNLYKKLDDFSIEATLGLRLYSHTATVVGSYIYLHGGKAGAVKPTVMLRYDPATRALLELPNVGIQPPPREQGCAFAYDGKLFVYAGGLPATNELWRYDPATNEWTKLTSGGWAAYGKIGVLSGNLFYTCGVNANVNNFLHVYNITTGIWSQLGACPFKTAAMQSVIVDGIIYTYGGYDYATANRVTTLWAYDIAKGTWSQKAPGPYPVQLAGCWSYGGKMYLAGGYDGVNRLASTVVYDPTNNVWTALHDLPKGNNGSAAALFGTTAYISGGDSDQNIYSLQM